MSVSKKNRIKHQNRLKNKNKKPQTFSPFATPYEELAPIDPDEFAKVFNFAMQASMGQVTLKDDPSKARFKMEQENGSFQSMQFGNSPYILMIAAINEIYEHDTAMSFNATLRFNALLNLIRSPKMSSWIIKDNTSFGISELVVKAAATVSLQPDGEFNIADIIAILPPP